MWEKSQYSRPQAPKIRKKPGPLKQKRRKDADEEPSESKKSKTDATKLPKKYKESSFAYCGTKGHTKRSCSHRKADDIAAALATAATAVVAKEKQKDSNANETIEGQSVQDGEVEGDPIPATDVATSATPTMANTPSEIVLLQTPFSQSDNGDQKQFNFTLIDGNLYSTHATIGHAIAAAAIVFPPSIKMEEEEELFQIKVLLINI
ncbi:hypothetical protein Ahy_A05g021950 [Arachis hypogaea]|uniref:CCHC-type domain-containing protein n=1 Tax=Arachis hypogaea TaxID=3818 RepID=A0A445CZ30_ARAHY|nr:hypothetical protein Ahy_A05g021950 [Arachis hypogaea]